VENVAVKLQSSLGYRSKKVMEPSTSSAAMVIEIFKLCSFPNHPKERSTSCISALIFILSNTGINLDSAPCKDESHVISMFRQPWPQQKVRNFYPQSHESVTRICREKKICTKQCFFHLKPKQGSKSKLPRVFDSSTPMDPLIQSLVSNLHKNSKLVNLKHTDE